MLALLSKPRNALLGGAGSATAMIAAVSLFGWTFRWHWGDVPTWVGALATLAALAAAAAGAVGVFRQLKSLTEQVQLQREALALQTEQSKADRDEAERRAAQELEIRRVELRQQALHIEVTPAKRVDKSRHLHVLRVENHSDRPIRQVACKLVILVGPEPDEAVEYVQAMGKWTATDVSYRIPVPVLRRQTAVGFVFGYHVEIFPNITFRLRFTDDAGLHWELTDDMHLAQIPDRTEW